MTRETRISNYSDANMNYQMPLGQSIIASLNICLPFENMVTLVT